VQVLLDTGADVHATDASGRTALHSAVCQSIQHFYVRSKKLRIAKMLVSNGINVNAVDIDGETALAKAEKHRSVRFPLRTFLASLPQQQLE